MGAPLADVTQRVVAALVLRVEVWIAVQALETTTTGFVQGLYVIELRDAEGHRVTASQGVASQLVDQLADLADVGSELKFMKWPGHLGGGPDPQVTHGPRARAATSRRGVQHLSGCLLVCVQHSIESTLEGSGRCDQQALQLVLIHRDRCHGLILRPRRASQQSTPVILTVP